MRTRINGICTIVITCLFLLSGCKTFYIPVASFKDQFQGIDSTNLRIVHTQGPMGDIAEYLSAPIDSIRCIDKNGNPFKLKNSPSLEIRFTENNNKRKVFFFDRILLLDSFVVGDRSQLFGMTARLNINEVKSIEIQDGHKKFKYVEVSNPKQRFNNHNNIPLIIPVVF